MFLFAQRLQDAAAPPIALFDDVEQFLRRPGERHRLRLVVNLPALGQHLHRHVEVFGEGVAVVAARSFDGRAAEDADRTGNHVDRAEERLRLADDVESLDVFERLQLRPDVVAVDDLYVDGARTDVRVAGGRHHVAQRVGGEGRGGV